MPIQDPIYHIILPVRANGQFGLHVVNSRQLLLKLVGTTNDMRKEKIAELFKGMLITRAKNLIADRMTAMRISFLEIHGHLNEISDTIRAQMIPMYEEYGMEIVSFFVNSISVPSDDPGYMKIRAALAAAKERELLAQGTRAEMDILGYSYQEKRTFDVLDRAAQNEGAGSGILGASMGMGMGVNVGSMIGGAMGSAMGNVVHPAQTPAGKTCPQCGTSLPAEARFCFQCGKALEEVCPNCGARLIAGARFCGQCGRQLLTSENGGER